MTGQEMILSRTYKDGEKSKGDLIAIAAIIKEACGGQIGVIIPQELKGQLRAREKAGEAGAGAQGETFLQKNYGNTAGNPSQSHGQVSEGADFVRVAATGGNL